MARALREQGYLRTGKGTHLTVQKRVTELGVTPFYAVKSKIVIGSDDIDDSGDAK